MTATITEPGQYQMDEDDYHGDPCPAPSLSSSMAKVLLAKSARHAWHAHPRLNPDFIATKKTAFDIGHAVHAMLLEGEDRVDVIEHNDYRTNVAKDARDDAYARDRIPLLVHQYDDVCAMVEAAHAQLAHHEDAAGAFQNGIAEQTLIWREGDGDNTVWCRTRLDWLPNDGNVFPDYKTAENANPEDFSRNAFNLGYDIQAAFYMRGIEAVLGRTGHFNFIAQEKAAPYALSVCALTPHVMGMAGRKVQRAIDIWRWCLRHDAWPGYPRQTCHLDMPVYAEKKWLDREERETIVEESGDNPNAIGIDWQAPLETS